MDAPAIGDEVRVVEHNDATRQPVDGGRVFPAVVIGSADDDDETAYIYVRYSAGPQEGRTDSFWRESGWRAWDGEFRWRLDTANSHNRKD